MSILKRKRWWYSLILYENISSRKDEYKLTTYTEYKWWQMVQRTMATWIRDWKTTGCFVWSQGAKDYVDLGATYQSYEFAGKSILLPAAA